MEEIQQLDLFTSEYIEEKDLNNDKSYRDYNWCLVSYAPIEELQPLLDIATHYAYILHDKDNCKDKHYHILVAFEVTKSFNQLTEFINSLKLKQNVFKAAIKDKYSAYKYLTHNGWQDKYQYNEDCIISDNNVFWSGVKVKTDKGFNVIEDIINGFTRYQLAKKYGRDYIINYQKYEEFAGIVRLEFFKCGKLHNSKTKK